MGRSKPMAQRQKWVRMALQAGVSKDTKKYLMSKSLSDVTLVSQGKEFPAHRFLLSCRSPVFERMFQHEEMREAKEGKVEITDIEPTVLTEMLHFMYTGEFSKPIISVKMAQDILKSAEKYGLGTMKVECSNLVEESVTLNNALELYAFGTMYNAPEITQKVIEVMRRNKAKAFKDAAALLKITNQFPNLVFELMK